MHRSESKVRTKKKKGQQCSRANSNSKRTMEDIYKCKSSHIKKNVRVRDENQNVDHCQSAGTDAIGLKVWSERRKSLLMGDFALMQPDHVLM